MREMSLSSYVFLWHEFQEILLTVFCKTQGCMLGIAINERQLQCRQNDWDQDKCKHNRKMQEGEICNLLVLIIKS